MTSWPNALVATWLRELRAYFLTPLAYVFIAIFLVAVGAFTFEVGGFLDQGRADLGPFFVFHPWLYLVFLPAIGMRLWSDELRSGTIELLLTFPAPVWSIVLGKFLAAWTVAAAALALTFPMWLSVAWLGSPDHGAIALSYAMSFMMAGAYLAIACAMSALGSSQVVAFVIAVTVGFLFTVSGLPIVQAGVVDTFGAAVGDVLGGLSLLARFEAAQRGVLELRAVVFYVGFIALWLALTTLWISARRERP